MIGLRLVSYTRPTWYGQYVNWICEVVVFIYLFSSRFQNWFVSTAISWSLFFMRYFFVLNYYVKFLILKFLEEKWILRTIQSIRVNPGLLYSYRDSVPRDLVWFRLTGNAIGQDNTNHDDPNAQGCAWWFPHIRWAPFVRPSLKNRRPFRP